MLKVEADRYAKVKGTLSDAYNELISKVIEKNRLLVLHFDDCQEFFNGHIEAIPFINDQVKVGDVMGYALRIFSKRVSQLKRSRHILWVFSGKRSNLSLDIQGARNFESIFNVAKDLEDFNVDCVSNVFEHYYRLDDIPSEVIEKFSNLCGPPKFLRWFIEAAQRNSIDTVKDFVDQWDNIEDIAMRSYRMKIESSIIFYNLGLTNLTLYAIKLCWLHTLILIDNTDGFLRLEYLFNDWTPFVEAGLVRVGHGKLYPPNRFLAKIFKTFVKWFDWEAINKVVSNLGASKSAFKGRVLEFLFVFELCGLSTNWLWNHLYLHMNLRQKKNWKPRIEVVQTLDECVDQNCVYVISELNFHVVFYAQSDNVPIRVLCQLASNPTLNTNEDFYAAVDINPLKDGYDYCIFLAPASSIQLPDVYKSNCFVWDRDDFMSKLGFPLGFCDPFTEKFEISSTTGYSLSLPRKRKRWFEC